jgi:glycosyltransferase involved in cell wall biosynthesis
MSRLLFVNHSGRLGGPAHSLLKLLPYLRTYHEVAVVVPEAGEFSRALAQEHIPCHIIPLRQRYLPALAWVILRGRYDLVYGNNFSYRVKVGFLAAKLTRRSFIAHVREICPPAKLASDPWLAKTNAIIAVSQASACSVEPFVPGKNIDVIYNGIELDEYAVSREPARQHVNTVMDISDTDILVLSVGHIYQHKNQGDALEVAANLIRRTPSLKFCFLGRLEPEADYFKEIKHQIDHAGLGDHVRFLGFRRDITSFLRGADIFLHTSVRDAHPRSVLEAMAASLPVVAYDTDGVGETVVSGQTGYLVPPGDTVALAEALEQLVSHPQLRVQLGDQGYQRVARQFTAEQTARRIQSVIDQVLEEKYR